MKFFIPRSFGLHTMSKANTRRLLVYNLLILLAFSSCKTIVVPEKWVFKKAGYNYERVVRDMNKSDYNVTEKDSILKIYNTIINTDEELIATSEGVSIWRKFLKKDTLNLEYFVFEPRKTEKTGLFFIGNTSSIPPFRNELTTLAQQTNSKIYVLNYRGYGKTNGTPSFNTQFNDNKVFLDEIIKMEHKVDYVIGYSLGSVFATQLAVENEIPDLYLLSPFSNAKTMLAHQKKALTKGPKAVFRPFLKIKAEEHLLSISNSEKIKGFKGDLVIMHGTDDEVLPYSMGADLFKNAVTANKKIFPLKDGKHNAPFQKEHWNIIVNEVKM